MSLVLALGSCSGSRSENLLARASLVARQNGWQRSILEADGFQLLHFRRAAASRDRTLTIYIAGDGYAWRSRFAASDDPTPTDHITLRLALQDRSAMAAFLGRPCQYIGASKRPCTPDYWTSHRYAPRIVAAIGQTIDRIKREMAARSIVLIGYSGGGSIAVLVARGRTDVKGLITVAANLDHRVWTSLHAVSPLSGSLNPAEFAVELESIPQIHFVGGQDEIVPRSVVAAYMRRMPQRSRARMLVIEGFSHSCCWVKQWPSLLARARSLLVTARINAVNRMKR